MNEYLGILQLLSKEEVRMQAEIRLAEEHLRSKFERWEALNAVIRATENLATRWDEEHPTAPGHADPPKILAPGEAPETPPRRGGHTHPGQPAVDYEEAAHVYLAAVDRGDKPIQALMDHFEVERSAAKNWPTKMRELGLIPQVGEVPRSDMPMQFVPHRGH